MKKRIAILAFLLLLTACSKTENKGEVKKGETGASLKKETAKTYFSYLDNVDLSKTKRLSRSLFLDYDPSEPKELKEITDYTFLGRVLSIDGIKNIYSKENPGTSAFTVGKIEVLENVVGKLPQTIDFERSGGYIKTKDYYKYDFSESVKKMNQGRVKSGLPKVEDDESYMEVLAENDIHLKAGDVYLFYALYDKEQKSYLLTGYSYGSLKLKENGEPLEKVKMNEEEKIIVGDKWQVQNEQTKEKQDLGDYLEKELGLEIEEK